MGVSKTERMIAGQNPIRRVLPSRPTASTVRSGRR